MKELVSNPYTGLPLVGRLEGFYRDRVGDYRIIYAIDERRGTVLFHDVAYRKKVYD